MKIWLENCVWVCRSWTEEVMQKSINYLYTLKVYRIRNKRILKILCKKSADDIIKLGFSLSFFLIRQLSKIRFTTFFYFVNVFWIDRLVDFLLKTYQYPRNSRIAATLQSYTRSFRSIIHCSISQNHYYALGVCFECQ